MKRTKTIFFTALAILCTSFTASATVITLDFNAAEACGKKKNGKVKTCINNKKIDQSYGDGAGVDVVYTDKSTSNGNKVIRYRGNWDDKKTGGAIYAGKNNQQSMGQIEIKSLAGAMITLLGFDLVSAGTNRNRTSAWKIEDLVDGMILNKSGMIGVSGVTKVTTQYSSTSGFKITWGHNAFKVGLDNLSYSITSIPEPGPLALFGIGLLGLTVMRKKIA